MDDIAKKSAGDLRLVRRQDLDPGKWDRCTGTAPNAGIYSAVWYLDLTAGNWDALVMDDYEYVMPIPSKSKAGIRYVYTPFFTQQMGIMPAASPEIQRAFAVFLTRHFSNIVYGSDRSLDSSAFTGFSFTNRRNRVLELRGDYASISRCFSKNTLRNIGKAGKYRVEVRPDPDAIRFVEMIKACHPARPNAKALQVLNRLTEHAVDHNRGIIYTAFSPEDKVMAGALFMFFRNRAYYLAAYSTEEGLKNSSAFAIVDEFIRIHAGTEISIDFEGSESAGVDRFYKGFGAEVEPYFLIQYNRLPAWLWWLKSAFTRR